VTVTFEVLMLLHKYIVIGIVNVSAKDLISRKVRDAMGAQTGAPIRDILRVIEDKVKRCEPLLVVGVNYKPAFKTIAEIKTEYSITEQVHADALYAALSKITAAEIATMPSLIIQSHTAIVETFGKESKGVLRAGIAYKQNDDAISPDPTITWLAFTRTHITEREGTGTLRKVLTKVNAIASVLSISPSTDDNLVEYEERLVRRINGLKENHGFDVMKTIFADESELALLFKFEYFTPPPPPSELSRPKDEYISIFRSLSIQLHFNKVS
jgi:hypothetical protein